MKIKTEHADIDIKDENSIKTEESDIFVSDFDVTKHAVTDHFKTEPLEQVQFLFFTVVLCMAGEVELRFCSLLN